MLIGIYRYICFICLFFSLCVCVCVCVCLCVHELCCEMGIWCVLCTCTLYILVVKFASSVCVLCVLRMCQFFFFLTCLYYILCVCVCWHICLILWMCVHYVMFMFFSAHCTYIIVTLYYVFWLSVYVPRYTHIQFNYFWFQFCFRYWRYISAQSLSFDFRINNK